MLFSDSFQADFEMSHLVALYAPIKAETEFE